MTPTICVEAVGIGKHFGSFHALSDASLKVIPGSVHGLLGEDGAGKSTLVKCPLGYFRADEGSFIVDGRLGVLTIVIITHRSPRTRGSDRRDARWPDSIRNAGRGCRTSGDRLAHAGTH